MNLDFIQERKMFRLDKVLFILTFFMVNSMHAKERPVYVKYVHEIVNQYIKEMEREHGLHCIGSGGGMSKDVEEVGVMFTIQKKVTSLEEARELEVAAIQKLLDHINNHPKIRPFLREYPFKYDRVRISISFDDENNQRYTDGSIVYMYQARNKIFYKKAKEYIDKGYQITDPDTNEVYTVPDREATKLIDYYDEPYEEAVKKIKSLPKN